MNPKHKELAAGRWNSMSLVEQMANIGSEVERTIRWQEKGNPEQANRAADRALELFDLTMACPANQGRRREVGRAREEFCGFVHGDNEYNASPEALRRYYLAFGIAARGKV